MSLSSGFYDACLDGDIKNMELLYQHFGDPHIPNNYGFHYACVSGKLPAIQWLISKGANMLSNGVYRACEFGHVHVAKYLMTNFKIVDHHNDNPRLDNNLLIHACTHGQFEIVKFLVSIGADCFDEAICRSFDRNFFGITEFLITQNKGLFNPSQARLLFFDYGDVYKLLEMGVLMSTFTDPRFVESHKIILTRIQDFRTKIHTDNILIPDLSNLIAEYSLY